MWDRRTAQTRQYTVGNRRETIGVANLLIALHGWEFGFLIWFTRPPDESTTTMWLLPALTPAHYLIAAGTDVYSWQRYRPNIPIPR